METLEQRLRLATMECLRRAEALVPEYRGRVWPSIEFVSSKTRYLGTAYGSRRLEFNLSYASANPEAYIQHIIPHEVAHIVANATGLGKGHDKGWRDICMKLGGHPRSTINLSVFGMQDGVPCRTNNRKRFHYVASCGTEIWLSTVMHKRVQAGQARLVSTTKGRITYSCFTGKTRIVLGNKS